MQWYLIVLDKNKLDIPIKIGIPVASAVLVIFIAWGILLVAPSLGCIKLPGPNGPIEVCRNPISSSEIKDGLHGNVFASTELNYKIEIPNENWEVHSNLTKVFDQFGYDPKSFYGEDFLGGVVLISREYDSVVQVTVNKIEPSLDLNELIDLELAKTEEFTGMTPILIDSFVSEDDNYAIFEARMPDQDNTLGKEILRKHNELLYAIVTMSGTSEFQQDQVKTDINRILESFRILNN